MNKQNRTLLIDGYQPLAPKSGSRLQRDPKTGELVSTSPRKLPKTTSGIKAPNTAKES